MWFFDLFFIALFDILPPHTDFLSLTRKSCTRVKNCFHFVKLLSSCDG